MKLRRGTTGLLLIALLGVSSARNTFSQQQVEATYAPSEGILETVAVLRRHIPDDTYRFPPAKDFSGRNVYRASLLRLENLERAESAALRTGYMDAVLFFAKARALERVRAYDLAANHYRESARLASELRETALSNAAFCERLGEAVAIGLDLRDPLSEGGVAILPLEPDRVRVDLEERIARLSLIESELEDSPYRYVAQEEIERADMIRAHYFVALRHVIPDGALLAVQELQRVATRHGGSKNRLRHLLRLADLYSALATEYVDAVPAATLDFDPARFSELSQASIRLYQLVASHDGRPEKIEATRKLEAFLALTLGVDADRYDR